MSSWTDQTVDCMAKCTDNLTDEELNLIIRDVYQTLTHPKGNKLYERYLAHYPDRLACLNTYNTCSKYLNEEQNRSIEGNLSEDSLIAKVKIVEEIVSDMNEIDLALMKEFKDALEKKSREALFTVLENTKVQCERNLSGKIHEHFADYIISRYKNNTSGQR